MDRRATKGAVPRQLALSGRIVDYSFSRRRRRTLGLPAPRVALSSARSQWGICSEDGSIRLSWRLVHLDPALADYVIAHEVAHLAELNHSKRFWSLVARLYPEWREARERLELAGASLPLFVTRG